MKRKFNWLGFVGIVILLAGAAIFRSRGSLIPWWLSWILGPLLWYVGGGLAIGSLIPRLFTKNETEAERPRAASTQPEKETELAMSKVHVLLLVITLVGLTAVSQAAPPPAAADGAPVYTSKCQMCHGADGAGKTPMGAKLNIADLRSDAVQKQSDADLAKVVAGGKNKMQGYEGKLTKQQIADVVAYVKTLKK